MKKTLLKGMLAGVLLTLGLPSYAEGVKWLAKCLDTNKLEVSQGTTTITPTIETNVVKIAGTSNKELKVTLKPGENMAMENGQTFVVVEANITFNTTKKLDHLTVGANKYVNKTGSLLGFNMEVNNHKLTVFSILDKRGTNASDVQSLEELLQFLYGNEKFEASEVSFYLQPNTALSDDAAIEIYNIGFYTLGDILTEYSDLASSSWQFNKSQLSELSTYTETNTKAVKITKADGTTTLVYNYLRARSLKNMPEGFTKLDLRNMNLAESETAAIAQDAFVGLTFSDKILLSANQYKLFPTMNQYVTFPNAKYKAYKDGVEPSKVQEATDGQKKVTAYSYTRNFKAGNNSCVLPFDVATEDLTSVGLAAYVFESCQSGKVNFKSASGTIAAGTPLLIKAEEAGIYMIPAASTPNLLSDISGYKETSDAAGNKFVGSFVKEVPSTYSNLYGLDTTADSFKKMGTNVYTTYYRAFLSLATASAGAKESIDFSLNGETTGISQIEGSAMQQDAYYNLQGVRMNAKNLPHGIYIHLGKKVVK